MKSIVSKKFAIITSAVLILLAIAAALIIPTALGKTNLEKQLDLGRLCLVELDYEGAILAFERAIEIDPNNADAYIGLAEAYLALDKTDDARALFEKSYTVFGNVEVMLGAASALSENGDYEAAVFALEIALQYDAKNENIYILLADAYIALGREDDARAILEAGLLETGSDAIAKKLNELFPAETDEITESEAVTETESVTETEIVTETETETDTEAVTEEVDGTAAVDTEEVTEPVTEPVTTGQVTEAITEVVTTERVTEAPKPEETTPPVHTHTYGNWKTNTDSHWKECAGCDSIADKANHNYKSVVTPPTTTERGYTTHICSTCGYSYVDSYVDVVVEKPTGPRLEIVDPNLEAALRDEIGKYEGDLYVSDFASVTSLNLAREHIQNLSGISPLASLTNLTELFLDGNQISDISPLANLTNLTKLDLDYNQISDVSPLSNLTNLTRLDLEYNQISNISPLANLTNLTRLNLNRIQISDISPLANLTNLTWLSLCNSHVSDFSPLANLTNLTTLSLNGNQISDISPLAGLTNLTDLDLGFNQISDISPLSNLTNLMFLVLGCNQISDISPLTNLTNLTELTLSVNQIRDISPLANLTNPMMLMLIDNPITDWSPVDHIEEVWGRP